MCKEPLIIYYVWSIYLNNLLFFAKKKTCCVLFFPDNDTVSVNVSGSQNTNSLEPNTLRLNVLLLVDVEV